MPATRLSFSRVVDRLAQFYGEPDLPRVTEPFEMILWENIAYLANDARRAEAFEELQKKVGLRPVDIRQTSDQALLSVTSRGIVPEISIAKLRRAAQIAGEFFGDDLSSALKKPTAAVKDLRRFPSIGQPAAEKILLFNHKLPALAPDSNGLRVLVRMGFAPEKKNYSATYRGMQQALAPQLPADCGELVRAHQLLRRHGQQLCKRSKPLCLRCPLRAQCPYFAETLHV